jgi:hypothetical protein
LIYLTSYKIVDAVFGAKRKCRIIRSYFRTIHRLRFLAHETFCGREAPIPVTALLDQKGDILSALVMALAGG